jgi:hypothetical protein
MAADSIRLSQNIPGDSKPIVLYADQVFMWKDGTQRVLLLKGTVTVEQGVLRLRARQAVAWVDQDRAHRTGVVRLDLYAEGEVLLDNGPDARTGATALLDLNTRGEIKLRAQKQKAVERVCSDDPLFRRGLTEKNRWLNPDPPPIQRTSGLEPGEDDRTIVAAQWPPPSGTPATLVQMTPPSTPGPPQSGGPDPVSGPPGSSPVLPPPRTITPGVGAPVPGPQGMLAQGPPRQFRIVPRTSATYQVVTKQLPNGEQAIFITGGVILTIRDIGNINLVDIEADRLVFWTHGNLQQFFSNMQSAEGHTSREIEFYLAGNVEIRSQSGKETRTLRADEIYYDVSRNVAVARSADLELKQPGLPDPVHFKADELLQLSANQFKGFRAEVFSSRLPSDPGLKIYVEEGTLTETKVPKRSIFGRQVVDRVTGQPEVEDQRLFHGDNIFVELEKVPIFYFPFLQGDANDPLGPLEQLNFKYDRIFGAQLYTTFNAYDLIGIDPIPGTRWKFDVDYLSARGPALGTQFDYAGNELFDIPGKYYGLTKAYGINDTGTDILGGFRGQDDKHPHWRGRFLERHTQELPEDFTLQLQVSVLSDKNFLEQYYKLEFDQDINQETFVYLKQQRDNWAWTVLAEPHIRNWVTETEWLPRTDGWLLGQSFFNLFTYNVHASAGYARLEPTDVPPPPFDVTSQEQINTGRFDLLQELSIPFTVGPIRMAPYALLDLTYYTEDLAGDDRGRFYGAAGLRSSMPLSHLYPDLQSQLLNVNGIYHKIVLSSNFYVAHSDTPFTALPQLDRLNDDATDQALRDIKPIEAAINPAHGALLATSPLYDPQVYAIRRLLPGYTDTMDSVEELELDVRQRLQTKRGYPGMQHTIDWMTLDLSASYFPRADRDNFGESFSFLQYDYTWNIGDRTALVSTGWFDPVDNGARVFTIGAFLNRPDRTNFYLGYRQIEPLQSEAVTGAVTYVFSPKYAMTASSTYDFGINQSMSNSLIFTRMGSDLQMSLGITYNAILNNFGVVFEILPNLVPESHRVPGMAAFGSSTLGR